jgi:hypothetical protein
MVSVLASSAVDVDSSPNRIKSKTMILVFVLLIEKKEQRLVGSESG